jgi:NADH:ubiquinone oxidoreductase subunit 2 (subunit N)
MAGVPPLIGFFSKQYVLYSAIQNGYNFIAFVCIFVSVISASYYLKIIKTFFIEPKIDNNQASEAGGEVFNFVGLSNFHSFLISSLTLLILFFIFNSSLILSNTHLLSLSLFYQ